jgi:hypothetical protein
MAGQAHRLSAQTLEAGWKHIGGVVDDIVQPNAHATSATQIHVNASRDALWQPFLSCPAARDMVVFVIRCRPVNMPGYSMTGAAGPTIPVIASRALE